MRAGEIISSGQALLEKVSHFDRSDTSPPDLEPEEILSIVTELIHWYQRRRSTQLAMSISQYIELLTLHPDIERLDSHVFCEYRQLRKRWEYLALPKRQADKGISMTDHFFKANH